MKWINVEDRLPEDSCAVLGYVEDYESIMVVYYEIVNKDWYYEVDFGDDRGNPEVTHWMSLPARPKDMK